jgi:peptide/nickel transport system permease protein
VKLPHVSIFLLFFVLFAVFFGEFFIAIDPYTLNANAILVPPSAEYWLGTDRLGRDIFSRIIEGGKVSIIIGVLSALITTVVGFMIGALAGFFGKSYDKAFVIIVDLFLTFPTFFLLLTMASYINASIFTLIFIISVTGWMTTARLIRSESFEISAKPYIKILHVANVSKLKILFKYYAPLLAPIFFVSFTFGVGGAILAESGLSFLGLGIMPPQMSWGTILSEGKEVVQIAWWVSFFPGLFIFLVTFSLINISDFLQQFTKKSV